MQFALFLTGGLWVPAARTAADHAASGLSVRFHFELFEPLLSASFLLFLLLFGFCAIHWVATRSAAVQSVNAMPTRPTSRSEWRMGAAIGWAAVVITLIPMVLAASLHPNFWLQPRGAGLMLLSLITLLVVTLTTELAFRGYLFTRLIRAIGPSAATLGMSAIYAAVSALHPQASRLSVFVTFLFGIFLSLAYLRTHALWLPWGLHFGWAASMGVLFGLPVGGVNAFSSLVDTSVSGPDWLTGGFYGPEGALIAVPVLLLAMAVLYHFTRDLAWQYTHAPIVAAGYAMDVAPPAEHVKMEQSAASAPLVQILSVTPSAPSTMPAIEEHLRANVEQDS